MCGLEPGDLTWPCLRIPTPVPGTGPSGEIIVMVALGHKHSLMLTAKGKVAAAPADAPDAPAAQANIVVQVWVAGDNTDGQCAKGEMKTKDVEVGKTAEEVEANSVTMIKEFEPINFTGPPVIKVCGFTFNLEYFDNLKLRCRLEPTSRCCWTWKAWPGPSAPRSLVRLAPAPTAATTRPTARSR